jgi:hypothetical protein
MNETVTIMSNFNITLVTISCIFMGVLSSLTYVIGYTEGVKVTKRDCPNKPLGELRMTINDRGAQYCVYTVNNRIIKTQLRPRQTS